MKRYLTDNAAHHSDYRGSKLILSRLRYDAVPRITTGSFAFDQIIVPGMAGIAGTE